MSKMNLCVSAHSCGFHPGHPGGAEVQVQKGAASPKKTQTKEMTRIRRLLALSDRQPRHTSTGATAWQKSGNDLMNSGLRIKKVTVT